MAKVFIESNNIISSLGWSTRENMNNVLYGSIGIKICNDRKLSDTHFPASLIDQEKITTRFSNISSDISYTKFEKLCILSIYDAVNKSKVSLGDEKTVFILSTTKGNVELLSNSNSFDRSRLQLWKTAEVIAQFFGVKSRPVVVSNACISGVAAMLVARRLIKIGKYDNAVVVGADILSKFIVSGFQSFLSLSAQPCQPFDIKRDGLTLGEAVATVIISKHEEEVELVIGAISNDANHISGPSRKGEGLLVSIHKTLDKNDSPDLISAHGTATQYNDDMESIAIAKSGLSRVPVNSLKGYFGHTLGAAGILESLINIEAMKQNRIIKTMGFSEIGVAKDLNVINKTCQMDINSILKIASGFGGCNASALFRKN